MPRFVASVLVVLALCAASSSSAARGSAEWRSLDGSGNNREHPDWGKAGTAYVRDAFHYSPAAQDVIARQMAEVILNSKETRPGTAGINQ